MKRGRTEIGAAVGAVKERKRTNQDRQRSRNDLPRQAEVASAGRDLEGAVGVVRRTVMVIGVGVLMIAVVMMRLGKLLEKMMHLMGCGID